MITVERLAILGGLFAPAFIVTIVYCFIRYKAYNKKNITVLIIALGVGIASFIILHPKQRLFLTAFELLMIPLGLIVAGLIKIKDKLNR